MIETINLTKNALNTVPFKSHMDLIMARNLRVNDRIDFRDNNGKYVYCTIMQKQGSKLSLNLYGKMMECDYNQDLDKLAVDGSISSRPGHRLGYLKIGDFVDINPCFMIPQIEWTFGEIVNKDIYSGQIEVKFEYKRKFYKLWVHIDNVAEVAIFGSKCEKMKVSIGTEQLNWTNLSPLLHKARIKYFKCLNYNTLVAISDEMIYKYSISMNKWDILLNKAENYYFDNVLSCCINARKTILCIFTGIVLIEIPINDDNDNNNKTKNCNISDCNIKLQTFREYKHIDMIMIDDDKHFMITTFDGQLIHLIWNKYRKDKYNFFILSETKSRPYQPAFIHCKTKNILIAFGGLLGSNVKIFSLKRHKWFTEKLNNSFPKTISEITEIEFGYVLTSDEKYVIIFPGYKGDNYCSGWIFLLEIENMRLFAQKGDRLDKNMLQNVSMFHPVIANKKTAILVNGYLRIYCYETDRFITSNVRLLSQDAILIIEQYFGYDNDDIYVLARKDGFLRTTKVNKIIEIN